MRSPSPLDADLADLAAAHGLSPEALEAIAALVRDARAEATVPAPSSDTFEPSASPSTIQPIAPEEGTVARVHDSTKYDDLGPIGAGGMGEVRRVRDRELNRTLAMKVVKRDLLGQTPALLRFVEEAQIEAQLQHPGIPPVHEIGRLADGRIYFTMKEVRGRTLSRVIQELHAASADGAWGAGASGWTLHRTVDAIAKVAEAMGYAHSRGVVHRDLKPANVMIGAFGEVLVIDWGLAKPFGRPDPKLLASIGGSPEETVFTARSIDADAATRFGSVAGTPPYMPPEQARGEVDRLDARTDVYAIGAMLYEVLCGRRPYAATNAQATLQQVIAGPPPSVRERAKARGLPLPEPLVAIVEHAMAREPDDRPANGQAVALEIRAWLEGARLREQAMSVLAQADALAPDVERHRERARVLLAEARALLADVRPWEPEPRKLPGWALEDEARREERAARLLDAEAEHLLNAAFTYVPDLPEAHEALTRRVRLAHAAAEAARDDDAAAALEVRLKLHALSLPEAHPERRRAVAWLKGDGTLTLFTDPDDAEVALFRYETHNRRLVAVPDRTLRAPLRALTLPHGSYVAVLRAAGRAEVRLPVAIGRGEHAAGVPPGEVAPGRVALPPRDAIGPDDCYVPPGWFLAGGDDDAVEALPRTRLWCDGFVMQRFAVTNRQYLAFLDDLVVRGDEAAALRYAPRELPASPGERGALLLGRDDRGRFELKADGDGDLWHPDWPITMIDLEGAVGYCRWLAATTGLPWRLPAELEWEKAARGVDARLFPWGDVLDPAWACMRDSHRGRPMPQPVDTYPIDESPYGVRGLGGNACCWCADPHRREGPETPGGRVVPAPLPEPTTFTTEGRYGWRGGSWSVTPKGAHAARRHGAIPTRRGSAVGLRLVRSWPG